MPKLVAVYGTLKKGHGNHRYLMGGAELLGEEVIKGFKMYSLGYFPAITPSTDEKDTVLVEVYKVPDEDLPALDGLEGYRQDNPEGSMYLREGVETSFGNAYIYVWNPLRLNGIVTRPHIADGAWMPKQLGY